MYPLSREFEERINRARTISWICEAFAVVFVIFGFICTVTLMQMSGEIHVLTQLIPKDIQTSDDFVYSDAVNMSMLAKDAVDELYVRRYIMLRHENLQDEKVAALRFAEIYSLSFPKVAENFIFQYDRGGNKADALHTFVSAHPSTVEFKKVYIGPNKEWQVEFDKVFVNSDGQERERSHYWAALSINHLGSRQRFSPELANPLGFIVQTYSEQEQK